MRRSLASNLPPEVLERIFSAAPPENESQQPLLSDKQRLRCQLVCKSWQHALDARHWPLWRLELVAEQPDEMPEEALWLALVQPAVRHLSVQLGNPGLGVWLPDWDPAGDEWVFAVEAMHGALLALQPRSVLSSLYLGAPFSVLQHIAPDLGCFIGLRQLELKAHPLDTDDPDDDWDRDAVLTAALLRHLPPQLERLTASYFDLMQLAGEDEGEEESTAGGGGPPPPPLLPALTQLHVYNANEAVLDAPLPSLAALSFELGNGVSLVGDALQLPQLTYLGCANVIEGLQLRAGAMPALAYIQADCALAATDGYSALGSLTQLHLQYYPPGDHPGRDFDLLRGVASTLRSLWMEVERDTAGAYEIQAGEVAAAARLEQLTHLELQGLTCLLRLRAWPNLRELVLHDVYPSEIQEEHLLCLMAAPSLELLLLSFAFRAGTGAVYQRERRRLQELQELPLLHFWVDEMHES